MICAARNAACGRSRSAAERVGRECSEDGAVHPLPTQRGVCALGVRPPTLAQSPPAQPHQGWMEQVWRDGTGSFRFNAPDEFLHRHLPALRSGK